MTANGRSLLLAVALLVGPRSSSADVVTVRHPEGIVHGFLVLRSLDGRAIADGDLIQNTRGTRVTSRLVFRFKDGSVHDETAVYSQRDSFQLISDRLTQKGPAFPRPLDMSIDVKAGTVVVHHEDEQGRRQTASEHMTLPPDLANGMVLTLLKNIRSDAPPKSFSFIAATPKPRLLKLDISSAGREKFSTGGSGRSAIHYVLKAKLGGVAGLVAPLIGKQPPDSHVWILEGEAPAFVKSEQTFFVGGPLWRIELVSPVWSQ